MKKILYVILHGSVYKDRVQNIKKTWGDKKDILFYSDYEDTDNNVIKISDRTDYHSSEEKHINIINFLNKNTQNYEWFFFCDDDTFVNTEKLENCLNEFDKDVVHGSVINCWAPDNDLKYCSGGAGYLISEKILKKLTNVPIMNTGYSDVTLGLFLKENEIRLENSNYFNSQNPNFYNIKMDEINNFITFHYIKTEEEMKKINNIIKK